MVSYFARYVTKLVLIKFTKWLIKGKLTKHQDRQARQAARQ